MKAFLPEENAFVVVGPARVDFPDKHSGNEKGGKSGQIKNFLQHGSTPQVIPEATYELTIVAKSRSGEGRLAVVMSASDWSTGTQYSTLVGSERHVLHGTVGTEYTTLTGSYRAPKNSDAWFLQGSVDLQDETEYTIDAFRIYRKAEDPVTRDFRISLNGTEYGTGGALQPGETQHFSVSPETLTNHQGDLQFQATIGGNQQGMARLIFEAPLLFGRNGQFRIDRVEGTKARITLLRSASKFSNQFKLLPFSRGTGPFSVKPGTVHSSESGRRHAKLPIQADETTIDIIYGH